MGRFQCNLFAFMRLRQKWGRGGVCFRSDTDQVNTRQIGARGGGDRLVAGLTYSYSALADRNFLQMRAQNYPTWFT
jgi:hypothetical protein